MSKQHRVSEPQATRIRVAGIDAVSQVLVSDDPVRCLVLPETDPSTEAVSLAEAAQRREVPVYRVARRRFERLQGSDADVEVLALVGPEPKGTLPEVMNRGGVVWLLTGIRYPGNIGFAIRTAEVSGADGVYIDNEFEHAGRREATRASMRADRFMPVGWEEAADVFAAARAAGKRIVCVEDVGTEPPWRVDLASPALFVVGAESEGIPAPLLADCDAVTRLPMGGFIASYNLQTAVASIAIERFRQLEEKS